MRTLWFLSFILVIAKSLLLSATQICTHAPKLGIIHLQQISNKLSISAASQASIISSLITGLEFSEVNWPRAMLSCMPMSNAFEACETPATWALVNLSERHRKSWSSRWLCILGMHVSQGGALQWWICCIQTRWQWKLFHRLRHCWEWVWWVRRGMRMWDCAGWVCHYILRGWFSWGKSVNAVVWQRICNSAQLGAEPRPSQAQVNLPLQICLQQEQWAAECAFATFKVTITWAQKTAIASPAEYFPDRQA